MRAIAILGSVLALSLGCSSGDSTSQATTGGDSAVADSIASDSASTDTTAPDGGADTSTGDTGVADSKSSDAPADGDAVGDAGGCTSAATTEACVTCCRQPDAPNYGGFELYAYDTCSACTSCKGLSPCGTNVTPPAGKLCVDCLQKKIASSGLPATCGSDAKCKSFALCMESCPLK